MEEALKKLHTIEARLYKKLVDGEITITMHRSDTEWYYRISIIYKFANYHQEYTITARELLHITVDELYYQLLYAIKNDILWHFIK